MRIRTLLLLTATLLAMTTAAEARRAPNTYSVELVDPYGNPLPSYWHGGNIWIQGNYNQRYNVKVTNHTGQRIEAVATVDGRDVLSGASGDYATQRGYIVPAWGSVTIEGFRRSNSTVAAFRFTTPGDSYAGRMGSARNVGVIGVAIFKERRRRPVHRYKAKRMPSPQRAPAASVWGGAGRGDFDAESTADAPMTETRSRDRAARRETGNNIGTRYGEDQHSAVVEVSFVRARQRRPNRIMSVYYDDAAGLARRGIRTPHYSSRPNPFPQRGFAPAPP